MKERIAYAYENGDVQYLDALMAIDDFSNIINQSEYVEQISAYDQTQLNELIEIKKNIMEQENLLADKLAEVEEPLMKELVSVGQRFSSAVCQSFDNYVSSEFGLRERRLNGLCV